MRKERQEERQRVPKRVKKLKMMREREREADVDYRGIEREGDRETKRYGESEREVRDGHPVKSKEPAGGPESIKRPGPLPS